MCLGNVFYILGPILAKRIIMFLIISLILDIVLSNENQQFFPWSKKGSHPTLVLSICHDKKYNITTNVKLWICTSFVSMGVECSS
jgi:hypothetical protein